jgi:hypothetical protein
MYTTKIEPLRGTSYGEVRKKAFREFQNIRSKSRRKPYVRSAYFHKDKIFLNLFWSHTFEKEHKANQMRRLRLFACGIELIRYSRKTPTTKEHPHNPNELLHRFLGRTPSDQFFFVQIKENKRTNKKQFISVFPVDAKKAFR